MGESYEQRQKRYEKIRKKEEEERNKNYKDRFLPEGSLADDIKSWNNKNK
nr:hypothetical protein [uncultured Flavobacterium sp.]